MQMHRHLPTPPTPHGFHDYYVVLVVHSYVKFHYAIHFPYLVTSFHRHIVCSSAMYPSC